MSRAFSAATATPASGDAPRIEKVVSPLPTPTLAPGQKQVSRLGPTVVIEGEVTAEQDLVIEGHIRGEVLVQGDVTLEKSARLEANIQARNLTIHGYLLGDVLVDDKVQIQPTGTMIGQLVAARLTVADGARFKGQIHMGPDATEKSQKHGAMKASGAADKSEASGDKKGGKKGGRKDSDEKEPENGVRKPPGIVAGAKDGSGRSDAGDKTKDQKDGAGAPEKPAAIASEKPNGAASDKPNGGASDKSKDHESKGAAGSPPSDGAKATEPALAAGEKAKDHP